MRTWLLGLLLGVVGAVNAQIPYTIILKDELGLPVGSASVSALGTTIGGITNTDGRISISLPPSAQLQISCLGYEKLSLRFDSLQAIHPKFVALVLAKKANEESGVTISTGRFQQQLERVTISTMVMKPAELTRNNSVTGDDAINRMSGVSIVGTQANIRGNAGFSYGAGQRVMILLDGLPMLSADAGSVSWDYLPIENAAQIEVIKGASSAMYGSSALGGVINILTRFPESNKGFFKATSFVSMFDQRNDHPLPANFYQPNFGVNFSAGKKFGKLSAVVGGNAVDLAGYRAFDNTKRIRLNSNLRYTINDRWVAGVNLNGSIDSSANYIFWQNYDSCYFPANNTASLQSLRRVNVDPYLIFYQNNTTTHTFRNRWYSNANLSDNVLYRSSSSVMYSEYNFKKQTKLFKFNDGALNLGSVYIHNAVRSEVMYGNRTSNNYAVYGQLDQTSGKWNASVGGRLEYFQIEDQKPNVFPIFRGGVSYQLNPATTFRASAGQGFRTASVAERYANTRAGAIVVFSNPDLNPERGTSLELGARQLFKWKNWQGFVDVAGFRTSYKNLMEFTPWTNPANGELGFTSKNLVADSRITGVEVTAGIQQKWGNNVLSLQPGYTYMNPRNLGYFPVLGDPPEAKWLKYRYRHLFRGDVNLTVWKWDVGTNIRYNSFMLRIDDIFLQNIPDVKKFRDNKPGGDWVVDVRLFRKLNKNYSLGALVKNLFNEEYLFIPGNIGQPRSFHIQLNVAM